MIDINMLIKRTKKLSLLYVEDNKQSRIEIIETLSIFFEDITVAIDGQDGIEKFLSGEYDLIITDIRMPRLNGIEMIEKIRDLDKEIPIIVVSAHDESSYFIDTIKFGIESYLLKPFTSKDLTNVFHKVTENIFIRDELNHYKESLEQQIEEKVEELNRQNAFIVQQARQASMGEMINNIAHQWRQPLNRINSTIAVIRRMATTDTLNNEILSSKIKSIEKNTKYMSNTIEDFSNFLHPDKIKTRFLLKDAVEKTLDLIRLRIHNIEIVFNFDKDIWVYSFEKEYRQILMIIVNNAIENFILQGTEKPQIDIDIKSNDSITCLTIHDNGGGIKEKIIDRVFEPYFTTKFSDQGTGLGLYMAKIIVERSMHGQLEVENKDAGALFVIQIPEGEKHD